MKCIKCGTEHPIYLRCPENQHQYLTQQEADRRRLERLSVSRDVKYRYLRESQHPSQPGLAARVLLKQRAVESKGAKCVVCGYDKCMRALEFHHLDPNRKSFTISAFVAASLNQICVGGHFPTSADIEEIWKKVSRELKKCVLLCSNCHREVEDGMTELKGMNGT
jgi:hypothetical protein